MKVGRETWGVGKVQRDLMTMVAVEVGVWGQCDVGTVRDESEGTQVGTG